MKNKTTQEVLEEVAANNGRLFFREIIEHEPASHAISAIKDAMRLYAAQFEQKWQEVDPNDLPKGEVIAWNGYCHHLGELYNRDGYVVCATDETELPNVTHWQLPTTPITKPISKLTIKDKQGKDFGFQG